MFEIFGIPSQALFGQLLLGLINGSFYALLSLGLAVIFGMLNIINFTHGAQYMMGAFAAYLLLQYTGLGYWSALIIAPILVGIFGMIIERSFLQWLYKLDHLYGLLLTFGLALIIEGLFAQPVRLGGPALRDAGCAARRPEPRLHVPAELPRLGDRRLARGLPRHLVRDRAHAARRLSARRDRKPDAGARLRHQRAAHDHAHLRLRRRRSRRFAGVMAAPIYNVSPQMGSSLIIVVFAVVVIGGMGSIMGAIVTGFGLGVIEGLTKVFFPEASNTVIFIIMAIVLLVRPAGLFGRTA